ncbi:MAG: molybdopterin molybdotransferase MoeA [Saprospiraceae bacterium]
MLTPVSEATQIVLQNTILLPTISLPLAQCLGQILCENVTADRDFPPFNRVAMDGIAIDYQSFSAGQRTFKVENIQAAGSPQLTLADAKNCLEVMTGAVLPVNADTVIRYEDVTIENGQATINIDTIRLRQNVHHQGTDRSAGEVVIPTGTQITPAEIATAASAGKTHLVVLQLPKAAIISTGDELVEIDQMPLPHQIRKSNVYAIQAALQSWGITGDTYHLVDDPRHIKAELGMLLNKYDFLILSGGVSKGKFDFIPQVLDELGVKKLSHRVQQKPGKPFWFGTLKPVKSEATNTPVGDAARATNSTNKVVFALPGNPVSTFMCTHRYVQPWLRASLGLAAFDLPYAILESDFNFKPNLTYFLQVKTRYGKDGKLYAQPVAGKGSGDLANLNEVDGFLELPNTQTEFKQGEAFPFLRFR